MSRERPTRIGATEEASENEEQARFLATKLSGEGVPKSLDMTDRAACGGFRLVFCCGLLSMVGFMGGGFLKLSGGGQLTPVTVPCRLNVSKTSLTPMTVLCPVREPESPESAMPPSAGVVELVGFSPAWLAGSQEFRGPILVTGGAGYIGSHMSLMLLEKGFNVVIIDNLSRGSMLAVRVLQAEACRLQRSIAFANLDLGIYEQIAELLQRVQPTAVLHFAGNAYASESMAKPLLYYQNITENTLSLLRAMEQANLTKLIFSSSCATYGNPSAQQVPVNETLEQKPISVYGHSKLVAEKMILAWTGIQRDGKGRCVTILRYFNVYGADLKSRLGPPLRGSDVAQYSRLPDALIEAALGLRSSVPIFGTDLETRDGTAERDYIHVWDLVGAHMEALAGMISENSRGRACASDVYNLGTGTPVSVQQMISATKALFPEANFTVEVKPPRLGDPVSIYGDARKALARFGWQAAIQNATTALQTSVRFLQKHASYFDLDLGQKAVLPEVAAPS